VLLERPLAAFDSDTWSRGVGPYVLRVGDEARRFELRGDEELVEVEAGSALKVRVVHPAPPELELTAEEMMNGELRYRLINQTTRDYHARPKSVRGRCVVLKMPAVVSAGSEAELGIVNPECLGLQEDSPMQSVELSESEPGSPVDYVVRPAVRADLKARPREMWHDGPFTP